MNLTYDMLARHLLIGVLTRLGTSDYDNDFASIIDTLRAARDTVRAIDGAKSLDGAELARLVTACVDVHHAMSDNETAFFLQYKKV